MDAGTMVDAGVSLADSSAELVADAAPLATGVLSEAVKAADIFNLDKVLNQWNALLCVAVWIGIQTARRVLPKLLAGDAPLAKLLPLAPMVICNAAMWVPGPWLDPSETGAQRAILGTILGALTANGHAVASKLGLHSLLRVEADPAKRPSKRAPPAPPKEEPKA
jgi:hypothetical protein